MYKLYKIETDVPEEAITKEGEVKYVHSIGGALASRFGTTITYTGQKEDALEFDKKSAENLIKEYPQLEMEKVGDGQTV